MKTYRLATASAPQTYRLATKDSRGNVILFGPTMARNVAETKRKAIASLTSYPVYMINTYA
jgi:hypothetical protein